MWGGFKQRVNLSPCKLSQGDPSANDAPGTCCCCLSYRTSAFFNATMGIMAGFGGIVMGLMMILLPQMLKQFQAIPLDFLTPIGVVYIIIR